MSTNQAVPVEGRLEQRKVRKFTKNQKTGLYEENYEERPVRVFPPITENDPDYKKGIMS